MGKANYRKNGRPIKMVKLVRRATLDGLLEMCDHVILGTKYIVYSEPELMNGIHIPSRTPWTRMMYEDVDGGWLPVELVEDVNVNG
jgi:hypothetical protein